MFRLNQNPTVALALPLQAKMADATSVEDRINLHQLMELKAVFERADTDGGGSLDIDEFLEAFGGVLGKNMSGAAAARPRLDTNPRHTLALRQAVCRETALLDRLPSQTSS